jgi:hypothetical protein
MSTPYDWNNTFRSISACSEVADAPLLYAYDDGNASFTGFQAFGGWKTPTVKEFILSTVSCNVAVSVLYKP